MSLEKIKQRIKMIENNDFNINESVYSPKLDQDDVDTLKADYDTHVSVTKASKAVSGAEKIARDTLGGDSSGDLPNNSSGNYINLPSQYDKQVSPILSLVKKYNITDDVDTNGKPVFGYTKPVFKGGRNNTLLLQKSGIVQIEFIDDSLSKLKSINVKKYKSKPSNVDAFFNDVTKNKNKYGIVSVVNTTKFIVIKFI